MCPCNREVLATVTFKPRLIDTEEIRCKKGYCIMLLRHVLVTCDKLCFEIIEIGSCRCLGEEGVIHRVTNPKPINRLPCHKPL